MFTRVSIKCCIKSTILSRTYYKLLRCGNLSNIFSIFSRNKTTNINHHQIYGGNSIKPYKDSASIIADPNYYINLETKYGSINYKPLKVVIEHAKNCYVWDVNGKRYLDFTASYATVSQGHCHSKIRDAIIQQMNKVTLTSRVFYNAYLADYQQMMCTRFDFERFFMASGGCEAAESSWKMARAWGYIHKKIQDNNAIIVFAENNFAGRSIAAISASTDSSSYINYGPYVPNYIKVKYNDISALEELFKIYPNICAYYFESIQGEAGIIIPQDGYLRKVRDLCTKYNILMIVDDIQMGLFRTGYRLSSDYENIKPDLTILGKALSGGYLPISAVGGRKDVIHSLLPGTHGSTYSCNPMACSASYAAIDVLYDENLGENSKKQGEYLNILLQQIKNKYCNFIKDIRGRGLAIGLEIYPENINIDKLVNIIIENGLLIKASHGKTLRISPPLTITSDLIEEGVNIIEKSIEQYIL